MPQNRLSRREIIERAHARAAGSSAFGRAVELSSAFRAAELSPLLRNNGVSLSPRRFAIASLSYLIARELGNSGKGAVRIGGSLYKISAEVQDLSKVHLENLYISNLFKVICNIDGRKDAFFVEKALLGPAYLGLAFPEDLSLVVSTVPPFGKPSSLRAAEEIGFNNLRYILCHEDAHIQFFSKFDYLLLHNITNAAYLQQKRIPNIIEQATETHAVASEALHFPDFFALKLIVLSRNCHGRDKFLQNYMKVLHAFPKNDALEISRMMGEKHVRMSSLSRIIAPYVRSRSNDVRRIITSFGFSPYAKRLANMHYRERLIGLKDSASYYLENFHKIEAVLSKMPSDAAERTSLAILGAARLMEQNINALLPIISKAEKNARQQSTDFSSP